MNENTTLQPYVIATFTVTTTKGEKTHLPSTSVDEAIKTAMKVLLCPISAIRSVELKNFC